MRLHRINFFVCLNPVCSQIVGLGLGLLEMSFKELLDRVCVPLGNAERLHDVSALIEQLDLRVEAAQIFDLEILELAGPIRLDERLDLRICAELARANFQHGFRIFSKDRSSGLLSLATFHAMPLDLFKAKVFKIFAGRTKQLRFDEA